MDQVISMLTALILIIIILVSGGARTYFKRKFDISEELKLLDEANRRHTLAKKRLHNVHN